MAAGADDRVARELDVFLCNGALGADTKLMLVQYPLRHLERGYDVQAQRHENLGYESVRLKPRACKLELTTRLDEGDNYDSRIEDSRRIKKLTLASTKVEPRTSLCCGVIEGDKLLLTPFDAAVQMRPSFAHLDAATAAARDKGGVKAEPVEEEKPDLVQLTVQVKKRENERQAAARMSSYAYLNAQVEEEPWVDLQYYDLLSSPADHVMARLRGSHCEVEVPMDSSRQEYLREIVPGPSERSAMAEVDAEVAPGDAAAAGPSSARAAPAPVTPVSDEAAAALPGVVATLFRHQPVCNMQDIRNFFRDYGDAGAVREYVDAPDGQLHEALTGPGRLLALRRVYVQEVLNKPDIDPLRTLVLDMFKAKETLKRLEIMKSASAAGLTVSDSSYNKIMRALCESKGGQWMLKTGKG